MNSILFILLLISPTPSVVEPDPEKIIPDSDSSDKIGSFSTKIRIRILKKSLRIHNIAYSCLP
jgi:hypothetical protein